MFEDFVIRLNNPKYQPQKSFSKKKMFGILEQFQQFGLSWHETGRDDYRSAIDILSTTDIVLHELAHFQIATPKRRLKYNFGLGFIGGNKSTKKWQWNEESLASILGILWEWNLGLNYLDTLKYHQWYDEEYDLDLSIDINRVLKKLYKMNLITKQGECLISCRK